MEHDEIISSDDDALGRAEAVPERSNSSSRLQHRGTRSVRQEDDMHSGEDDASDEAQHRQQHLQEQEQQEQQWIIPRAASTTTDPKAQGL